MRGACTDSMIKPDVPLQGFEPSSSSSHVHIRYNLPVVLRPPSLQTIACSWAPQWSKKVVCEGQTSHVCTLSKLLRTGNLFTAWKHMEFRTAALFVCFMLLNVFVEFTVTVKNSYCHISEADSLRFCMINGLTGWLIDVKAFSPKCSELSYCLRIVIKMNRL